MTGDRAVLRLDLAGDVSAIEGLDWLDVSAAQIDALGDAIMASFEQDPSGQLHLLPPAPWGETHVFFRAKGRFHILHTCNAWVGETLREAGIPLGIWTPTTQALAFSLWWHHG